MGEQKRGVSGLISHIEWSNISSKLCKAKLFVNFLLKLYPKKCKIGCIKAQTPFSPIFLEQIQNVSKKVTFKNFGYFCCLFFPQVLEKGSLSLKKLFMWKYMKYWFQNGVVYISILSQAYSCKIFQNQKNGA